MSFAFIGAGGKTSLMVGLGYELAEAGWRVSGDHHDKAVPASVDAVPLCHVKRRPIHSASRKL